MRKVAAVVMLVILTRSSALAEMPTPEKPAAPTFQELMDPALFPDPQMGMVVESAQIQEGTLRIRTTGACIEADLATGDIRFSQRIGHERLLAVLHLGQGLEGAAVTHAGPGLARITFAEPAVTIRVNGDSLFMLHVRDPLAVSVDRAIDIAWHGSFQANHLVADEWGGLGLYCSEPTIRDAFDPFARTLASYALPADAVLWVGVCPPKPYDWDRSLRDNVVWHWSNQQAYPPDDVLRAWSRHGNIVLLQSELLLWKDWNLAFVPRLGVEEFARVRTTIHDAGMRFIVYTSPYYFLKNTALEPQAFNTFENFKSWPPGTPTGENMGWFLPEIRKVMREYQPDGLYFDGQYLENPAALYALARESRHIVGEDGILEWQSTWALGSNGCYLPQADAYVDFILRGEGNERAYSSFDYLRFFVSGYNISNSIGVLCNNGPVGVTPQLARDILKANARFHTLAGWLDRPDFMKILSDEYRAKLTPELRDAVERDIDVRQTLVAQKAAAAKADRDALDRSPQWGPPIFAVDFTSFPAAQQVVSDQNPNALAVRDGVLEIQAHANTYAFLRIPLTVRASGFVVKVRQDTDGGQSWGPGAMLRWDRGGVRVGTRSDQTLQSDILGHQLTGGQYDATQWGWLRVRWRGTHGVVERSSDGQNYERLWTFQEAELLAGPTAQLLVGKVPFHGEPEDYPEAGPVGKCQIDLVEVYSD